MIRSTGDSRTTRSRTLLLSAAVASFALLAACGGSGEPTAAKVVTITATPTPTPSSTPTATPSPPPTYLTKEEAGKRYLSIVAPFNKAVFALGTEADSSSPSLKTLRALATTTADELALFVRQLQATPWPPEIQPLADAVVRSAAADIRPYRLQSAAKSLDAFYSIRIPEDDGSAQVLRAALGLPEVPVG